MATAYVGASAEASPAATAAGAEPAGAGQGALPEPSRLDELSPEMRMEGKMGSRGLLAPGLLLVAAALLIFSEVYIRSGPWQAPLPGGWRTRGVAGTAGKEQEAELPPGLLQRPGSAGALSFALLPPTDEAAMQPGDLEAGREAVAALSSKVARLEGRSRALEAALSAARGELAQMTSATLALMKELDADLALAAGALREAAETQKSASDGRDSATTPVEEARDGLKNAASKVKRQLDVLASSMEKLQKGQPIADADASGRGLIQTSGTQRGRDAADDGHEEGLAGAEGGSERKGISSAEESRATELLQRQWASWLDKQDGMTASLMASSAGDVQESKDGPGEQGEDAPAPHLEDCAAAASIIRRLDSRQADGSMPYWSPLGARLEHSMRRALQASMEQVAARAAAQGTRKGRLWRSLEGAQRLLEDVEQQWTQREVLWEQALEHEAGAEAHKAHEEQGAGALGARPRLAVAYPPWVHGADEDNLFMTRTVQHDLWRLQHPRDCSTAGTKFLLVNASQIYKQYMGIGAQIAWLAGALAEATNEGRVMVIAHYERADHKGCTGTHRARWSCYFVPETTEQCREEALRLASSPAAWRSSKITFSGGRALRTTRFFFYDVPRLWGAPWLLMHRTVELAGLLVGRTHTDARRWWFAQATRYLMRYPSPRLCSLLNRARNEAFGDAIAAKRAQEQLLGEPAGHTPQQEQEAPGGPGQLFSGADGLDRTWSATRWPHVPAGLISVHVRQGDKNREMRLFSFPAYMALAQRIRTRFPLASSIWLSTEMESVVRESRAYAARGWAFYCTAFPRQRVQNESMSDYEKALGMRRTSDNAFVNLLVAAEADFFVGAMGSTWSVLIDNLRTTSGKMKNGFLTVNPDRYWFAKRTEGENAKFAANNSTLIFRL